MFVRQHLLRNKWADFPQHVNADYSAAKDVAPKLALRLQRGQKPPAGGAFCQYALNSGPKTANATDVASDTPVSAEQKSTDKPTPSEVGS